MMKKNTFILLLLCASQISIAQTLKDAIRLNENEQHDAANEIYQKLIAAEPSNGTVWYYYGENLIDADQTEQAQQIFSQGLQKDPSNALLAIGNAELTILSGNLAAGKTAINSAVQSSGNKNAQVLMEAAEALIRYKQKDLQTAQQYLDQAVKLEPKNPEVYTMIGDVYSELNNGTEAANNYNRALDLDKNQVKAYLHKGQLYKRSMNYDGAIAEFNNALKIDQNFAPAYREIGEAYYLQRKIESAKENYRKYLELSKNNNSARLRYTSFLFYSENYKDALNELTQITKTDSNNLGLMRLSSYLFFENADYPKATQFINRVFEMTQPDSSKRISLDYVYYGKILGKNGNDSLGAEFIKQAYQMDTSRTELLPELGNAYMRAKKYDEAVKAFDARIQAGGKITTTDYFNLGKALYQSKQYSRADSAFAKVTELLPAWPTAYLWRGRSNTGLDPDSKQGLAKPYYEQYIQIATADTANLSKYQKDLVEANRYLAYYYLVQKDCDQSSTYWKRVLEIDPTFKQAREVLDQIKADPKSLCR